MPAQGSRDTMISRHGAQAAFEPSEGEENAPTRWERRTSRKLRKLTLARAKQLRLNAAVQARIVEKAAPVEEDAGSSDDSVPSSSSSSDSSSDGSSP